MDPRRSQHSNQLDCHTIRPLDNVAFRYTVTNQPADGRLRSQTTDPRSRGVRLSAAARVAVPRGSSPRTAVPSKINCLRRWNGRKPLRLVEDEGDFRVRGVATPQNLARDRLDSEVWSAQPAATATVTTRTVVGPCRSTLSQDRLWALPLFRSPACASYSPEPFRLVVAFLERGDLMEGRDTICTQLQASLYGTLGTTRPMDG